MMDLQHVYSRLRMVYIVKGGLWLVGMLITIIFLILDMNTPVGESGSEDKYLSGVVIVAYAVLIVSFVASIFMVVFINKWRRLVEKSNRDSAILLLVSAIIGVVAPIVTVIYIDYYAYMFSFPVIAYILDTVAYLQLKDSRTMRETERSGFAKLFKSQMVILVGFVIVLFLGVILIMKSIGAIFGCESSEESSSIVPNIMTIDSMIYAIMVCIFVMNAIYFYFQIKGWNILAKAQSEEKTHMER